MLLGRVIGTVWATRKDEKLEGLKLQVVEQVGLDLKPLGSFVVAVDAVEAGVGEIVLVAQGSSARQTRVTKDRPVDAVIMAIVENFDLVDERALAREFERRRKEVASRLERQPEI
jgi:microcompartment protein CcmK/EutM